MIKVLLILLAGTLAISGCGIKGDPLPITASE